MPPAGELRYSPLGADWFRHRDKLVYLRPELLRLVKQGNPITAA